MVNRKKLRLAHFTASCHVKNSTLSKVAIILLGPKLWRHTSSTQPDPLAWYFSRGLPIIKPRQGGRVGHLPQQRAAVQNYVIPWRTREPWYVRHQQFTRTALITDNNSRVTDSATWSSGCHRNGTCSCAHVPIHSSLFAADAAHTTVTCSFFPIISAMTRFQSLPLLSSRSYRIFDI